MNIQPNGLPIHDSVLAELTAKPAPEITSEVPEAQTIEAGATPELTIALGEHAVEGSKPPKKPSLLKPSEFTFAVQPFITTINNARLDGQRTIHGMSFLNYAQANAGYIPTQEVTKFIDAVRGL